MKKIINEDQFIRLCNEELKKLPEYREGMEITGVPEGFSGSDLGGYSWKGPDYTPGIIKKAVDTIKNNYELKTT